MDVHLNISQGGNKIKDLQDHWLCILSPFIVCKYLCSISTVAGSRAVNNKVFYIFCLNVLASEIGRVNLRLTLPLILTVNNNNNDTMIIVF